jgi:hypothetical protein
MKTVFVTAFKELYVSRVLFRKKSDHYSTGSSPVPGDVFSRGIPKVYSYTLQTTAIANQLGIYSFFCHSDVSVIEEIGF